MTATPIPRTISLTLLGNLDISIIDTLPQNRLQIKTFLVPDHKKSDCYKWIEKEIKKTGCQAFIVCPFIDFSEPMSSVKSAIQEFEHLSKNIFPNLKLGLIHGKIKSDTRQKIIKNFQDNKLNILVTTPIIEVGVDIPNSSIIIIQSADRFGLAQLHQLRGRVGRGHQQSYCYLFAESQNQKAINRLEFLEKNHNGLKIAEYDLKTRGPGETFSTIQHGFPSLKIASFSDTKLINFSQEILKEIIKNYPKFNFSQIISENIISESINN
jgi:ATP-dependent DNA helicase RecG